MPAAIASSPISNGKSQSSPISSSKSNAGFTILPSTMRGTILLAAFVLTMIQIHLMFERTYQHASQSFISCQGDTTLKGNVTLVRPQDVTRLKDEWKIKPSALSGSAAATVQDDGTVGLNAPHSKHLPEINENGMIIFFLHIPKTGGMLLFQICLRNFIVLNFLQHFLTL